MSHPRNSRDPSSSNINEESGPFESSYFPSLTGHDISHDGPAPPLESTGDTLVASTVDIPASAATPITEHPPRIPAPAPAPSNPLPPSQARSVPFRTVRNQPSAIRLRRLRAPSVSGYSPLRTVSSNPQQPSSRRRGINDGTDSTVTGRRRSSSEPLSPAAVAHPTVVNMDPMPVVPEGQTPPMYVAEGTPDGRGGGGDEQRHIVVPRRFMIRRRRADRPPPTTTRDEDCYDSRVVDFLDVVDPEVATLSSITNIQNSLFVPSLGRLVNRRPTYDLSQLPFIPGAFPPSKEDISATREEGSSSSEEPPIPVRRTHSISTVLTANNPQYAILPDDPDHTLEGWSEEDIKLLNDHVRHLLHSRRSKIKQRFKGFLKYASRPLGFLVTLYATLITLFGLAWVLFLIGWIYVGEKQLYAIDVIDNVLVALFAVMGDGLIPWRLYDTYNMLWIAHYHRKTLKLRNKLLLPKLEDKNDLPIDQNDPSARMVDLEAARALPKRGTADDYYPVLTDEEQAKLVHYQTKLAKSHTFYKPHETSTHRAFPHRLAMTIILLLDLHSCLQVSLGTVTWSIPYERRPAAATTTILCCSITVNALAGILISVGDRRTRKKDVVERLVRQELTGEVMDKMVKERRKEKENEEKERMERENGDGEKEKGLLGMSWSDFTGSGSKESSKECSKTRSSSEDGRRGEGKGGRRSLDALTEGFREGFKRKSLEGRRSADTSETSVGRKEKDKVGRFDPLTGSGSGSRRSYSGGSGVQGSRNGNNNGNGLGSVAEADHEPHYQHVQRYQKQEQQGQAGQQDLAERRKMPGSFEE